MLRLQDPYAEGTWFKFKVRGAEIDLKIRAVTADVFDEIRKKHRRVIKERDPQTRAMNTRHEFDEDAITDDLIDHVLEDFKGVGDTKGNVLTATRETKKAVMQIPPLDDEQSVSEFVFEKGRELAATKEEKVVKN